MLLLLRSLELLAPPKTLPPVLDARRAKVLVLIENLSNVRVFLFAFRFMLPVLCTQLVVATCGGDTHRMLYAAVTSGESGAGKTEAAKLCLSFLAEVSSSVLDLFAPFLLCVSTAEADTIFAAVSNPLWRSIANNSGTARRASCTRASILLKIKPTCIAAAIRFREAGLWLA